MLITGPNMGGKSTHLRCAALLSILAQAGSFVPASSAQVGLVDRIFTRVGASDDIRRGRSTFMMEMMEVAHILKRATGKSLILLDEIGRGTSTFDGLSIAWSVTEDICRRIGARTLFATHYHQLIGLEGEAEGLVNVHVQVAESDGELKFLHTVADGPCDDSYGVQVAALAGLPRHVVERSTDLLGFLERQADGAKAGQKGAPTARNIGQSSLLGFVGQPQIRIEKDALGEALKAAISNLDPDALSPRQAHDALYELSKIMEEEFLTEPSRIKQLDERTIGHIAAGEVVERPAQVVKELVENSIDAGSNRITIEVERGGFDLIRITDNGSGIHESDLSLSLDRHATSKLSNEKDLAAIGTLGFRGEALASIGVVSRLTISSRPPQAEGRSIVMDNGDKSEITPAGIAEGTVIEVSKIFVNQPARLAFQRRPATETSKIVDVVVSHAISHPEVAFRLVSDEKTILEVPAVEEMEDRLYDVLGRQAGKMIKISSPPADKDAPGEETWSGWISTPDITRGKGDEIHVLINGRPVASQPFLQSIRRGYRTRLMQGRHPVAVLMLDLPHDEVDVNVHPTKREVRLRNSWRVLERLERSIAYTLESTPTEPESSGGITGIVSLAPQNEEKELSKSQHGRKLHRSH